MGTIIFILLLLCAGTCLIEIVPLLFFKNAKKWIKTSLLCNVITNPIINLVLALLTLVVTNEVLFIAIAIIMEIAVIVFETFIFYTVTDESLKKCIMVSVLINLCSFAIGLLLTGLLEIANQPPRNNFGEPI